MMDLVAIGNYISNLESKNIKYIKKLSFLGFNLWKVYRNYFCGLHYAKLQTKNKSSQFINKNIFSIFKFAKTSKNAIFLRVTSASYNVKKDDLFYSKRIYILKEAIENQGYKCKLVGSVSVEKKDALVPKIDCILDSLINFYAFKMRYIVVFFLFFSSLKHYMLLKNMEKISFKQVLSLQSLFLSKFVLYYIFYKLTYPKKVLFTFASYGCEAEIAALKSLQIEVLEYQHGHIYPEHYGYNYHKALKPLKGKLLIPDKFFVYGKYWKEVLLKLNFFDDREIVVSGNPNFENIESLKINANGKIPILVCSQPNSAHLFMKFCENYMKNSSFKDKYFFIIKLHPREVLGEWKDFVEKRKNIEISNEDTYVLLKAVDIQLTGSSTTLYEALYFNVSNYIILNDLKINESENFDKNLGIIIDVNWSDEFVRFDKIDGKRYFDKFNSIGKI